MPNPTDEKIAELERAWPNYQVWTVQCVVGGTLWCAKRWDWQPGGTVLNAHSAEELAEYLAEEAER